MEQNIIVGKAFCFPDAVKRIGVEEIAVDGKRNILAAACVIAADKITEPALNAAALIVIRASAFVLKVIACLKSVDKKVAHVFSCLRETFDEFFKIGHDRLLSRIFHKYSTKKKRKTEFATFLK